MANRFSDRDLTAQTVPNQFEIPHIAISTFLCISKGILIPTYIFPDPTVTTVRLPSRTDPTVPTPLV